MAKLMSDSTPLGPIPVIARYAIATLVPLLLIVAGAFLGGVLPLLALIWLTCAALVLDRVLAPPAPEAADPWAFRLLAGLGVGHLILLPIVLEGLDNAALSPGAQLALFLAAASFMGQISHPVGHELIHRSEPAMRSLGALIYTSMLFGHHASAHRLVHHAAVGTTEDPATPLPGEGFWAYVPRAWRGGFEAGFSEEAERLHRAGKPVYGIENPYLLWVGGGVAMLIFSAVLGGILGVIVFLALCALAQLQILVSDYVQHYGLQRLIRRDGRYEPVGPHHSWNAPRGFSSLLMINAPSHSEHHLHPTRAFHDLGDWDREAPKLPYAMPVMAVLATMPGVWRRVMDKRALKVMEAAEARLHASDGDTPPSGQIGHELPGDTA